MKIEHTYIVYIVECKDWSYYTGITNDLEKRLWEHNTGQDDNSYTYSRRPVELKYFETFTDISQAIAREKQLKGWSRKKKQPLIAQNFEKLKNYPNQKIKNKDCQAELAEALMIIRTKSPATLRQAQGDKDSALGSFVYKQRQTRAPIIINIKFK
jgi:putative endonuclease